MVSGSLYPYPLHSQVSSGYLETMKPNLSNLSNGYLPLATSSVALPPNSP